MTEMGYLAFIFLNLNAKSKANILREVFLCIFVHQLSFLFCGNLTVFDYVHFSLIII